MKKNISLSLIILFSLANIIIGSSMLLLGGEALIFYGLIFLFLTYILGVLSLLFLFFTIVKYTLEYKNNENRVFDSTTLLFNLSLFSPLILGISIGINEGGWVFNFAFIPVAICIVINVLNIKFKIREFNDDRKLNRTNVS